MIKDILKLLALAALHDDTYDEALLNNAELNTLQHNIVTIIFGDSYTSSEQLTPEQNLEGDKRLQEALRELVIEAKQACQL